VLLAVTLPGDSVVSGAAVLGVGAAIWLIRAAVTAGVRPP
jgi:hypothetical protein